MSFSNINNIGSSFRSDEDVKRCAPQDSSEIPGFRRDRYMGIDPLISRANQIIKRFNDSQDKVMIIEDLYLELRARYYVCRPLINH